MILPSLLVYVIPGMARMSPPLRASNEGLLGRALREHRGLTGPSHPLLGAIFSILLRASVGTSDRLLEHRAEAEVGNGIFEVGVQPLEGSHVWVGDVFHR